MVPFWGVGFYVGLSTLVRVPTSKILRSTTRHRLKNHVLAERVPLSNTPPAHGSLER